MSLYQCNDCGHKFEVDFGDTCGEYEEHCPKCDGVARFCNENDSSCLRCGHRFTPSPDSENSDYCESCNYKIQVLGCHVCKECGCGIGAEDVDIQVYDEYGLCVDCLGELEIVLECDGEEVFDDYEGGLN
jgi:DNA-directed RNA polymerase subunit RPC12/RpoP